MQTLLGINNECVHSAVVCSKSTCAHKCEGWTNVSAYMQTHVRTLLDDGLSTCTRRVHLDTRVIYVSGPTTWAKHFNSPIDEGSPIYCEGFTGIYAKERKTAMRTTKSIFCSITLSSMGYKSSRCSRNGNAFRYFRSTALLLQVRLQVALKGTISKWMLY